MRSYKCLSQQQFKYGDFTLVPIRDEDKYEIMKWRNEQIDILRQKTMLTVREQELYFKDVIPRLFDLTTPDQLLFSVLERNVLVGYGGLVHIDWESRNGEISFLTSTERSSDERHFFRDWTAYLTMLKDMVSKNLNFVKIYTYAYNIRPWLFRVLEENGFREEACLKDHVSIRKHLHNVRIHSFFLRQVTFRPAVEGDAKIYFEWVNEDSVRQNSLNQKKIEWQEHLSWFTDKIKSAGCTMLIAFQKGESVGQIRFEEVRVGVHQVGISIDPKFRGMGLGAEIISGGIRILAVSNPTVKKILAKIKPSNFASKLSFLRAGFHQDQNNDDDSVELYSFEIEDTKAI
jgi:RimJ/RimL family protein N-acetyltransferase